MTAARGAPQADGETFRAEVLVIGGGLSGTWAALAAAREGASVILADKGNATRAATRRPPVPAVGGFRPSRIFARRRSSANWHHRADSPIAIGWRASSI